MQRNLQRFIFSFTFLMLILSSAIAQNTDGYSLGIQKSQDKIAIDGVLDEETWRLADVAHSFYMSKPQDTSYARSKTEVRLSYDKQFLYVAAICYDSLVAEGFVVQSLKRDFSFPRSDAFVIHIDPFLDGTNGFSFACNAYGAQREGLLQVGGKYGVTTSWDNKWYSKTKVYDDRWVIEMAIPFKTLRFNDELTEWGINFSRNDQKLNEMSTWVPVPQNFNVANLAFTGKLLWDQAPKKVGSNVSLIPYMSAAYNEEVAQEPIETEGRANIGGDVKVGLSSSLNLDITINPDYSQVEVDDEQVNLTRFEIQFPEKRQFFLENSDLFGDLGFGNTRPFFSRRIGIERDSTGNLKENEIIAGARLSGKAGSKWRVGTMILQTERDEELDVLSNNFAVAAFQRSILARSNVTAFIVNKQGFGNETDNSFVVNDSVYNRVVGTEFNFLSKNAEWDGKAYYHHSFERNVSGEAMSFGSLLTYSIKKWKAVWSQESVGEDYNAEVGFIRRKDYHRFNPQLEYNMFSNDGFINYHGPRIRTEYITDFKWNKIEHWHSASYYIRFMNTSNLDFSVHDQYIELRNDFDPSRSGGLRLPAGTDYNFNHGKIIYNSDERRNLFLNAQTFYGGYYNGTRYNFSASLRYRIIPWAVFSVRATYDNVQLPTPYSDSEFWVLGPKVEILFSTKVFWTNYIQYNGQRNNFNIYSKLQYRFKPASDIFLVFTDNYLPGEFSRKNWGVAFKMTYWFNL